MEVLKNEIVNSTFEATNATERQIVERHIIATDKLRAGTEHSKVPIMYWLPKLHKNPFKFRFISASSKCTTTNISVLLTTALTTIKELIIKYCNKAYECNGTNYFWSVKNSLEVLDKLHAFDKPFESVDSYDFSTLYTTFPHNLIKQKFSSLINGLLMNLIASIFVVTVLDLFSLVLKTNIKGTLTGRVRR